jgi:NAD(P)-dependent dehydrogenase (short-subunit alcohol dehydrogenase family)
VPAAASARHSPACCTHEASTSGWPHGAATTSGSPARSRSRATSATSTRSRGSATRPPSGFGGIDIVVANAGVAAHGPFLDLSREHLDEMLDGMMTADDVAEVVVFALERPRHLRLLETALRPMTEASAG